MSYSTLRGFGSLVGQIPVDKAALCVRKGGAKSYREPTAYTFVVECNDGGTCVGGAEREPSCSVTPCPPTTSDDGPPGVPVYSSERPALKICRDYSNLQIGSICNQSRDPAPCYFSNVFPGTSWKNRVPASSAQAWRDWVQAKLAPSPFPQGMPPLVGPMQIGPVPAKTPNWRYGINLPGAAPPPLQTATPDPAAPPADHTMLYVGLGVGALVLIGGVAYLVTRKPAAK